MHLSVFQCHHSSKDNIHSSKENSFYKVEIRRWQPGQGLFNDIHTKIDKNKSQVAFLPEHFLTCLSFAPFEDPSTLCLIVMARTIVSSQSVDFAYKSVKKMTSRTIERLSYLHYA